MGNNPENLATMAEQLVDILDKCQNIKRLDFLAKMWKRLRPTFSDAENESIKKAAMRALAAIDEPAPSLESDVGFEEIGGVISLEQATLESEEGINR